MDDDGLPVPAVQCSVIQFCSDTTKVGLENNSSITKLQPKESKIVEAIRNVNNSDKDCNSKEIESKISIDVITDAEIVNSINNAKGNCNIDNSNINTDTIDINKEIEKSKESECQEVNEKLSSKGVKRELEDYPEEVDDFLPVKKNKNIASVNLVEDTIEQDEHFFPVEKKEIISSEDDEKDQDISALTKNKNLPTVDVEDAQTEEDFLPPRKNKNIASASRDLIEEIDEDCLPLQKTKNIALVNGEIKPEPITYIDDDDEIIDSESDEEIVKPRRRGRCKKNPELIPPHLAPDIALGYRMLLKFLETPQFSGFLRPGNLSTPSNVEGTSNKDEITCLNQIKKKFDENVYKRLADFVGDVRAMLSSVYTAPRNPVAVKRALRLEQVLEQRIAQLPNYLRPQCSLVLSEDEVSNSPKKIRINKGGGFVSLLLERADKIRAEKDREKRKVLAEERKHLKEEQDKDVQDWEKNILLKDHEEEIKSMWELPQIGHFIHLCANILNIGDVSQYEVERMLLMPQSSETLDLLMTALLSNSLVRAKLDRTPSMPYSIWLPLVRTRVNSWYRSYQREYGNAQKVFEEIGVEPEFWEIVGTGHSPLDYFYFHEIPLIQRVWILKTLCDVDFVRKKTVYDNIRQQVLEELQGNNLGVDRHGNRYIHFPQFGMTALRIYRQSTIFDTDILPAELVESQEGFEERKGEITLDKVFRDIWDVGTKVETPKKKRGRKKKNQKSVKMKVKIEPTPTKSLRQAARAKRKVYVDSSDSDFSDTDLATLKNKLSDSPTKSEKTFISLSVFRLPREKVKPGNMKKSYYNRKLEREEAERLRQEELEANKDKLSGDEESNEPKLEEDEDDDTKDNFTVKNLENLKMVLKKGSEDNGTSCDDENEFKYKTPTHLLPDSRKFYCVVDSVEGLRQLISQFASDENDLEIINRSTLRSGKSSKSNVNSPSCEVQLIERLQKLEEDLEAWEMDYIKTSRSIRDKLYKEYTSFQSRPPDFVHPNEAYWQSLYDEPIAEPPTVVEPIEPPVETAVPEADVIILPGPPSPLGGLRPRTRTRQQQVTKPPEEDLDDEDFMLDSPESDDNWEMPARKKKRSAELRVSLRQSKRPTKKPAKMADFSGSDVDDATDKSQKALFWSPRRTDPSEELNWETNRQKILEKHNSPRKVVHGDVESDMNEVENALKNTTVPNLKNRIFPKPIPGNRKPYYSSAQLKAMANKNKNDSEISVVGVKVNEPKYMQKKVARFAKPVMRKSAGTQSSQVIELDSEPSNRVPQTMVLQTQVDEYFITDGSVYIKIEYSFVQELMKNQQAVRKYANQLDLNKKIQIVKKKETGTIPSNENKVASTSSNTVPQTKSEPCLVKMMPGGQLVIDSKNVKLPTISQIVVGTHPRLQQTAIVEQSKPSNLRFVRPQNVPNPVQIYRPTQRVTAPNQTNYMYVQTSQPQNYVQLPSSVRPGLVQVVRPNQTAQSMVAVSDKNNTTGTIVTSQNILQQSQDDNNQVEYVEIISPTSNSSQVELIQVQSSGKQPQFVQVSQGNNVLQTSSSMGAQSILRLATTSSSNIGMQATPSYVRLASTGQIVQISPAQPPPSLLKSQSETSNSATIATNTIQNQTSSANQVTLLQVQGLPGEPISYIPVQTGKVGNFVQIQSPQKPIGQLGTIVQMASSQRQPSQVGRIMQLQTPPRPQGVVLQQATSQGNIMQMQIPKPMATSSSPRPNSVTSQTNFPVTPQRQPSPRQQTTLVQVYGSPRMQTTATQMQGSPRPQTIQVRNAQSTIQQDSLKTTPIKVFSGDHNVVAAAMQTVIAQDNNKISSTHDQQFKPVGTTAMTSLPQLLQTGNGNGQMVMVQMSQPMQQGVPRATMSNVSTAQLIQQPLNIRQKLQTSHMMPSGNIVQLQESRPLTNVVSSSQNSPRHTLVSLSHPTQLQNSTRPTLVSLSQPIQVQTNFSRPAVTMVATSQQTNMRPLSNVSAISQNTSGVQQTVQHMVPRSTIGTNTQVRPTLQRSMGPVFRVSTAPRSSVATNVIRPSGQYTNAMRPSGVPTILQMSNDVTSSVETPSSNFKLGNINTSQIQNVAGQVVRMTSTGSQVLHTNPVQVQPQASNVIQVRQGQNVNMNVGQSSRLPAVRAQYVQIQNSSKPVQISIQETEDDELPSSLRFVSQNEQLLRILTSDPKTTHSYQTQPILVRATGSKPAKLSGQPVTIKIDDEDEDLEIVEESVSHINDGFTL